MSKDCLSSFEKNVPRRRGAKEKQVVRKKGISMDIWDKLGDIQEMIGRPVYRLGAYERRAEEKDRYVYQIRPFELKVVEVRLGEARREQDREFYGPGFVTWLCESKKGFLAAFSPVGNEILSNNVLAGRQVRGFLNKEDLLREAEILKECILQNYKRVVRVEICLDDFFSKDKVPLAEQIAGAKSAHVESGLESKDRRAEVVR